MSAPTNTYWQDEKKKLYALKGTQLHLRGNWSGFPVTDTYRGPFGATPTRRRWSRLMLFLVLVLVGLFGVIQIANAGDYDRAYCDPTEPDSCIYPITEGEPAPFTGQLVTSQRAARLVLAMETCGALVQLETDRERDVWAVRYAVLEDQCRMDREAAASQFDAMQRRLEAVPEAPSRWKLVASVGTAATLAIALTVALVTR